MVDERLKVPLTGRARSLLLDGLMGKKKDTAYAWLPGFHALKHALRFGAQIEQVLMAPDARWQQLAAQLSPDVLRALPGEPVVLERADLARLVSPPHPTGILALAHRPSGGLDALRSSLQHIVFIEEPALVNNVGAVVRVAAAAGAGGVLTSGPTSPWHPAAIRAGAGLQFALHVQRVSMVPHGSLGLPLVAFDPSGEDIGSVEMPKVAVFAFGTERAGLSDKLLEQAHQCVSLPMRAGVSSLNLATSVSAALYVAKLKAAGTSKGVDVP